MPALVRRLLPVLAIALAAMASKPAVAGDLPASGIQVDQVGFLPGAAKWAAAPAVDGPPTRRCGSIALIAFALRV